MINNTIQTIISLSISGSILALILIALLLLLRNKASKAFLYYIWLLVLLRFALPLSFDNSIMNQLFSQALITQAPSSIDLNIRNNAESAPLFIAEKTDENIHSNITDGTASSTSNAQSATLDKSNALNAKGFLTNDIFLIWLLGVVVHFCWFAVSYLCFFVRIRKTFVNPHPKDMKAFLMLRGDSRVKLFCSPFVHTPILLGLFSPCIIIPQSAFVQNGMKQELKLILIHELTHHRRYDLLYKWFTVLVSSLHWFNPLMILIRREINRACELACDESVLTQLKSDEWPRYGEALLALASNRQLPTGIVTTTMCEEKRKLKERLAHIMNYKKITTWMITLSVAIAILLAGGGMALGASGNNTPSEPVLNEASPSQTEAISPADATFLPASPSLLVAVEDFNAFVKEDFAEDPYALLTVTLDDGSTVEKKYEGTWISQASTGDVDGDGKQDIILYLEVLGSSGYGIGEAHVLHIVDNELVEYPKNYMQNPAIDRECPESFEQTDTGAFRVLVGASSISVDGRDLLRIKHWLIDSEDGDDVIQYTDAHFNSNGWQIEDAGLVSGEDNSSDQISDVIR